MRVPCPSRREAPADEASPTTRPVTRGGNRSRKHCQSANIDQRKVTAILRMKVRRVVVVEEHLDDDAEEPTDLRHEWAGRVVR